ncbi:hypothetical protein ED208_13255 [Stagnimonas aquatica]|uniref:Uncharacterized protein n=1 Tax=Stagnimonas aquatica TaxID=2689987 RepID=A0A3N0V7W4_9GAMM|nr:hypothetical protein [Stagnimonas aquatica]ROH88775.1 hypothetical protein ED208_13255 [Stagnimonas aquatica]
MNDLSRSLRELPELSPPAGGWARLSQRLDARQGRRRRARWAGGLALAASLLLALPQLPLLRPSASDPAPSRAPARSAVVASLMQQSQALEQELATLKSETGVWNGALASNAASLQRDVALLDLQLSDLAFEPQADQAAAQTLWRHRVRLLEQLVSAHAAPTLTTTTAGLGSDASEAEVLEL